MRDHSDGTEGSDVVILGRFPPPLDGQSIATERLADLLKDAFRVQQVNTNYQEKGRLELRPAISLGRWIHYGQLNARNRALLRAKPRIVLWPAVSPDLLGHLRDVLTVLRHVQPDSHLVAIVHRGNFDKVFRSALTRRTSRLLLDRVDRFVFLDEILSDRSAPYIPSSRRAVVPNTIDDRVIASNAELDQRRNPEDGGPFRLLYLSNLIKSKGYLDVLEAAALLTRRGRNVRLTLIGRWPSRTEEDSFSRRLSELGMAEAIDVVPGLSDRSDVRQAHLAAEVMLLPTYYPNEAQPLTIIEALNAGTPIITTRHGGIPSMIDDGGEGFLIPSESPEAIANAVEKLMDRERWLRMSIAARQRFERQFHPDVVRQQWIDLIESVHAS